MLERLDYVRLEPARVLDAGSGPPRRELRRRYPRAMAIALDFSLPMLTPRGLFRWATGERQVSVCADMPVTFVVDPKLPAGVSSIALSYTFFEVAGRGGKS